MIPMASIRSLTTKVTSGGTPSRAKLEYFSSDGSGHLWVKSKELQDDAIEDTEERVSDEGLKNSSAKYLPASTVLLAMYGANVGQLGWLRVPATVNQAICGLIVDPSRADFRYVFYALMETRAGLIAQAQGAAQQNLNQDKIKDFQIPCPSLAVQRRIASILSAYDDLIENNTRRIAILEEMARRIYEEWFVRFHFPGRENVQMVQSELGSVPAGWAVDHIGRRFKTVLGGTPSRANAAFWEGGTVPWINSGKVNELRILEPSERITDLALARSATKMMPVGTTVLAITGATLGQVSMLGAEACANQSVVGVYESTGKWRDFVFWFFKRNIGSIIQHASGGAQQHINKDIVNAIPILLPDEKILEMFNEVVSPISKLVIVLLKKNINLRATRDFLLPRLISGELDVSDLPEPEAAAA